MNIIFFLSIGAIVVLLFLLLFSLMEVSRRGNAHDRAWKEEVSRHAEWYMSTLEHNPDGTRKIG